MQINGSMEVSQELAGAETLASAYLCDGWQQALGGTMVVAGAGGPNSNNVPGFGGLLYMRTATAQASLGAGHYAVAMQYIEGWRVARLQWGTANAQPMTIAFWSKHTRPGTYSGTIRNAASDRSYAFTYNHATANVAQYNVITIPGDTAGTWPVVTGIGLIITLALAVGTTFTAPSANAWLAGSYFAAPGQVNSVAATTDVFRLTGFLALPGIEAPSAARAPYIMRPYPAELLVCQRYLWVDTAPGWMTYESVSVGASSNRLWFTYLHPTAMRGAPTVTLPTFSFSGCAAPAINTTTAVGVSAQALSTAGAGGRMQALWASGSLINDARL